MLIPEIGNLMYEGGKKWEKRPVLFIIQTQLHTCSYFPVGDSLFSEGGSLIDIESPISILPIRFSQREHNNRARTRAD